MTRRSRSPRTRFAAAPACQFATFHGDDHKLASPVLERVCNGGQDHGAASDDGTDSLGPMMSVIAASDSVSLQA